MVEFKYVIIVNNTNKMHNIKIIAQQFLQYLFKYEVLIFSQIKSVGSYAYSIFIFLLLNPLS